MTLSIAVRPLAALALAAAALAPAAAPAQLVPRLVEYPVAAACQAAPQGALATQERGGSVRVFASANCAPDTLLFTIAPNRTQPAARTITPTALGVAALARRCSNYAWQAGTPQTIAGDCVATLP